jgi:uncharacterized membrane protein
MMDASWIIAVLLAAMASFISNLGVTLQKLHHLRAAADPRGNAEEYHQGWMWRVGLGLVFFGSLADFAALSFGPQSLVAPLGSLTLVSNVIFAPLLLKETIGHWDVLATVLIVVGSSVAVMFGSHESVTFTPRQLFDFFTHWDFLLYAIIMSGYIATLYLFIQKIEKIEAEDGVHSPRYLHYKALHRFAYPSLSGTVGAQSVLFAKAFVELLSNTVHHWGRFDEEEFAPVPIATTALIDMTATGVAGGSNYTDSLPGSVAVLPTVLPHLSHNMFVHWQTYFIFAAMLGAIFAQIKYLNEGLKRFDASYAVPVFTSFWIILSVLSGMIFYREYAGMNTGQCLFFAFGVLVTVTGVITLGGREQAHYSHQVLSQEEDVEGSENGEEDVSPDSGNINGANGSVNSVSQSSSSSDKSIRAINGVNGTTHHIVSSPAGHHHHGQEHGDEADLDLDLEAFDDAPSAVHTHHVNVTPNSSSHITSPSSSHPSHIPKHPRAHGNHTHTPTAAGGIQEEEGTVADGAKTAVIEASQRISQAFQKLRGKASTPRQVGAGERGAVDSIHSAMGHSVPASASSSSGNAATLRLRADSMNSDHGEASATDLEDAEDPLILRNARRSPSSATGSIQQGETHNHTSDLTVVTSGMGVAPHLRTAGSRTPSNSALYDPTHTPSTVMTGSASFAASPKLSSASDSGVSYHRKLSGHHD